MESLFSPGELADRLNQWTTCPWNQAWLGLEGFQAIIQSSDFPEDPVVVSWFQKLMAELLVFPWASVFNAGQEANYLKGK